MKRQLVYGVILLATSLACVPNGICNPFDSVFLTEEQRKSIEWQRDFNGSSEAFERKDYVNAERLGNAAIAIAETFEPDDHRLFTTMHNLINVYNEQKKWVQSERLLKRSLQVARGNAERTTEVYRGLGVMHMLKGDTAKSDQMMALALKSAESQPKSSALEDPESVYMHACLLKNAKRYKEAEPLMLKAVQLRERQYGTKTRIVADSLINLAELYMLNDKPSVAEPILKRAIKLIEQNDGDDIGLSAAFSVYGRICQKQKRFAESKEYFRKADTIWEKAAPRKQVKVR